MHLPADLIILSLAALCHCRRLVQAVLSATNDTDINYNEDFDETTILELPPPSRPLNTIYRSDPICASSGTSNTFSTVSPSLASGAEVLLHYNLDAIPLHGIVYVYGTYQPIIQETLMRIHNPYNSEAGWNRSGTGGDKRGWLLGTFPLSSTLCTSHHAASGMNGLNLGPWWCDNRVSLPSTVTQGRFRVYWVLDLSKRFPQPPRLQLFTSCLDFRVMPAEAKGGLVRKDEEVRSVARTRSTTTMTLSLTVQCTVTTSISTYTTTYTTTKTVEAPSDPGKMIKVATSWYVIASSPGAVSPPPAQQITGQTLAARGNLTPKSSTPERTQLPMRSSASESAYATLQSHDKLLSRQRAVVYTDSGNVNDPLEALKRCADPAIDVIVISSVDAFPSWSASQYPYASFGPSCEDWLPTSNMTTDAPGLRNCSEISQYIKQCQHEHGKRIFVSLKVDHAGLSSFPDGQAARSFADTMWKLFGPPSEGDSITPRPFGNAVVDGFDISGSSSDLAFAGLYLQQLKTLFDQTLYTGRFYSSAACKCSDAERWQSILPELDYIWIRLYNGTDERGGEDQDRCIGLWQNVIDSLHHSTGPSLYVGLLSWEANSFQGYLPNDDWSHLPNSSPGWARSGGVTMWDDVNGSLEMSGNVTNYVEATLQAGSHSLFS